ncbi:MAG: hypothetical protein IJU89_04770 [Alphaproteobacteria bacterium]|nr:hypothetical protein [Alphaproteobacteria bacterium]
MVKFIFCFCCICLFSGCSKVADLTSNTIPGTEQTGDPVYDNQTEMKLLLPWTWFV